METAMGVVGTVLVLVTFVGGIGAGFYIPCRLFGHHAGFNEGVAIGSIFSLILGVSAAHLFGGWGETLPGGLGIPLGILIGGFLLTALANSMAGALGTCFYRVFGWLHRKG